MPIPPISRSRDVGAPMRLIKPLYSMTIYAQLRGAEKGKRIVEQVLEETRALLTLGPGSRSNQKGQTERE